VRRAHTATAVLYKTHHHPPNPRTKQLGLTAEEVEEVLQEPGGLDEGRRGAETRDEQARHNKSPTLKSNYQDTRYRSQPYCPPQTQPGGIRAMEWPYEPTIAAMSYDNNDISNHGDHQLPGANPQLLPQTCTQSWHVSTMSTT